MVGALVFVHSALALVTNLDSLPDLADVWSGAIIPKNEAAVPSRDASK